MFNNYINGKEVAAQDGRTTPLIDPVTGKQYATAALSGPADVDNAMKAAADAFDSWKHSTPSVRQKAINDIADAMEANMTPRSRTPVSRARLRLAKKCHR